MGQRFVYQLETTGATSVVVSNPPPGLSLDTQGRDAIVGVPTAAGTFQVGISVTYPDVTTNSTLIITVQPVPAFRSRYFQRHERDRKGRVGRSAST